MVVLRDPSSLFITKSNLTESKLTKCPQIARGIYGLLSPAKKHILSRELVKLFDVYKFRKQQPLLNFNHSSFSVLFSTNSVLYFFFCLCVTPLLFLIKSSTPTHFLDLKFNDEIFICLQFSLFGCFVSIWIVRIALKNSYSKLFLFINDFFWSNGDQDMGKFWHLYFYKYDDFFQNVKYHSLLARIRM